MTASVANPKILILLKSSLTVGSLFNFFLYMPKKLIVVLLRRLFPPIFSGWLYLMLFYSSFTNYDFFRVTIVKDKDTRKNKGVAFIMFLTRDDAHKCCRSVNNTQVRTGNDVVF